MGSKISWTLVAVLVVGCVVLGVMTVDLRSQVQDLRRTADDTPVVSSVLSDQLTSTSRELGNLEAFTAGLGRDLSDVESEVSALKVQASAPVPVDYQLGRRLDSIEECQGSIEAYLRSTSPDPPRLSC